MKTEVIKRHISDSLKSLRRNGWMSVAAVSAVTVTLLLVGIFMAILFNGNRISQQVENDVQVRVYVDRNVNQKKKDKLRKELKDLSSVTKVTYRSKSTELNTIVSGYGSQWKMFKGDENPLNDVFIVETKSPSATMRIAKKAAKLDNVSDASYGGRTARKLFKYVDGVRNWGLGFTVLLLFLAVFLISNTIRITILSRREEIGVMRLVGATNSYIRWPFLLEGAWTGLLGSIIPMVFVDIAYKVAYNAMNISEASNGFSLYPVMPFLVWIDLLLAVIGIVIGAIGSVVSMRRFLKI
ncbi:permease-like cell division protein FtsX [Lacticaseibacillus hulanensis]|uniref:permease-like cell division protein FtsX n=1 Tax=Lacticaseibacillus hulanensis TaxID=2493111 RepID=UPI000FD78B03|nr:permease-like cell division protein FtsX [Lacticaseibacillus hulanensis]